MLQERVRREGTGMMCGHARARGLGSHRKVYLISVALGLGTATGDGISVAVLPFNVHAFLLKPLAWTSPVIKECISPLSHSP
jgi:hypothetical protein